GVVPSPTITVSGSAFTIADVPANSTFQLLASVPPTHHNTYSPAVDVIESDVTGVHAYAVAENYLSTTAGGFGITPSSTNAILLLHVVDASGAAMAGVAGSDFVLAGVTGASGPHFLDANLAPSTATATSASGWAMFFEVPPGSVSLGAAASATVTL